MAGSDEPCFAERKDKKQIEEGTDLAPLFDSDGLIPCIVTDATSNEVLMFAYMNGEALKLTIDTGLAHFWSRSRNALWKKGEDSGRTISVAELRIDCDQDVVWLKANVAKDGATCHLGYRSCFFRAVPLKTGTDPADVHLEAKEDAPLFDPSDVYKK